MAVKKARARVPYRGATHYRHLPRALRRQLEKERLVLVLSGGAPNSPLAAGALYALQEDMVDGAGRQFDAIYTAGAGALIGLLFVAPRHGDPKRALLDIVNVGIADPIYRMVPFDYKIFRKAGPFTELFLEWADVFKDRAAEMPRFRKWVTTWLEAWGGPSRARRPRADTERDDPERRLFDDWVDLVFTAMAPTTLTPRSTGLCDPLPFLDDLVDFRALRTKYRGAFYVNVWDLTRNRATQFTKAHLDAAEVRAALAFPFIYPPGHIKGRHYAEGAGHHPLSFPRVEIEGQDPASPPISCDPRSGGLVPPPQIVYIDVLGDLSRQLIRRPRDLWDAYGLSMITPIVALARSDLRAFKKVVNNEAFCGAYRLLELGFPEIPRDVGSHLLDWNYSNLCTMWDIGYEAGKKFWKENARTLVPPRES